MRVFGLSLDDYDFNLLIIGKQIGDILAFGHIENSLLHSRNSQLFLGSAGEQLAYKLEVDA